MEQNTTVDSQAEETTQSPADETQTNTDNQAKLTTTDDEPLSLEEARKLRNENKTLRGRAKTAEEKVAGFEAEKLTATEKQEKKLNDLTDTLSKRDDGIKRLLLQNAVVDLKDQFGLRASKSVVRLIDTDALEFDLDGLKVSGVDAELKRLKKEDPGLFITGGTDGGAGGTTRSNSTDDMNDIIRRAMKK